MKTVLNKWRVMLVASVVMCLSGVEESRAQGSVSLQVFYDELQPYGTWIEHGRHGYVWMPDVDPGFTPYATNGYWVNTSYGNTWVSDYSWGWAPFHYGRWFYDDFDGWLWVPDSTWAPAWVTWRSGGGYYGWAPLMPGFGISVSVGYYNHIPQNYWNFVPYRYVMYRHVYTHCVPQVQVVNVIHHTTVVTHHHNNGRDRSYFTGPERSDIERRNRERVPVYNINDSSRPGRTEVSRSSVNIYKPEIDDSPAVRSRAMPSKVSRDDRNADGSSPVTTRTRESSRQPSLDNTVGDQRRVRRSADVSTDENRIDRTMPQQRNPALTNEQGLQRNQNIERTQRQQSIDREQRDQQMERVRRDQNSERSFRSETQERQVQRPQLQEPIRRSVQPAIAPRKQREFNQVQPRQERPATRTVTPQVQRQQPARREPQLDRTPSRTPSTSPTLKRTDSRSGGSRGID
ncbi:MAG: DUF6600 domain-containing protein [Chryseolinea sp.]